MKPPAVSGFACNLNAISASDRTLYGELTRRVRSAMLSRVEIPAGYAYVLDDEVVTLPEINRWINMECLCCPFLTLELSATHDCSGYALAVKGAEGIRTFLDSEFPVPAQS